MDSPHSRRFTEDEVRAIFQETARRQATLQAADSPGLTLDELMAIAGQTGLDPELVAAAAAHLPADTPEVKKYPLWDVPEEVRVERVIPGEVSDELWERMVAELRKTFGQTGRAGQVGRVREWSTEGATATSNSTAPVQVEVRPEERQTRFVLSQSLKEDRQMAYVLGGTLLGMGLVLLPLLLMAAAPAKLWGAILLSALFAAMGLAAGFGTRQAARNRHRKQTATFESVLDRLDLLALRAGPLAAAGAASAEAAPLADALDAEEPPVEAPAVRRRVRE